MKEIKEEDKKLLNEIIERNADFRFIVFNKDLKLKDFLSLKNN